MLTNLRGKSLVINQIVVMFILVMLASIGFYTLHTMKGSADQMGQGKDVVADILPPPLYLIEAQLVSNDLLQAGATERQPLIDKLHTLKKDYDDRNLFWKDSGLDEGLASSLLGEQRKHADLFWKEVLANFIPAIQENNVEAARLSVPVLRRHYEAHRKGVDATVSIANKYAGDKLGVLASTANQGYWLLGIAACLGCVLVLLLAVPTINRIYRSLREAGAAAAAISAGDLTYVMTVAGKDEIGELLTKLATMRDNLRSLISQVAGSVTQLTVAAEQMSAATEQTSQGVRQQQSETDQVATAMNEMSSTVQEVARSAAAAAGAAQQATTETGKGKQVASDTITAIDELATGMEKAGVVIQKLEQDSTSIGVVLNVIKGIAEQTNLLALNAAIEAARAGDQGRGFAVVADEVRTLAQRTQKSTQEIQQIIEGLQAAAKDAVKVTQECKHGADKSVEQAAKTGVALEAITNMVAIITDMNTQIASAAEEQGAVAEEINRNIVNISQVATQTSSGSRHIAEGNGQLSQLAVQLQALIGRFKV